MSLYLPEIFTLASVAFATMGWLFLVFTGLAFAGVTGPFQWLDRLGVSGAISYGTALGASGAAPLVAMVGFARARSPRWAAFGFRYGLAAFVTIILGTIALVFWEIYKCTSGYASCD